MQVNNNLAALFVNRQIHKTTVRLNKSIEKLATGQRINRAGDDATNLAVSERMRTQIRGLKAAEQNAMNGLSFVQVAEGNLGQVNDILQRLRYLAVQAANGIYSDQDRTQIAVEVSQLIEEVDRISTTAEFNRLKLLTGDLSRNSKTGSVFFHVGPNKDQRIRAYIATMNAQAFGLKEGGKAKSIKTASDANDMIGVTDAAIDKLNRQRADLGAYYNRMEITIEALRTGYENMVAADSRIRDTDMAEELVEFTKNQILLQSGTAMLAQANFSTQVVLQLMDRI
ncbi:MAG: flagellin [Candidatus Hydrogenedentota bacterium]|nr:MAG: flagellin [Candidatus Hydrogenedentota bacterium]